MTSKKFDVVVENRINKIRNILKSKAAEYSSSADRLHNFKLAARIDNESPEKALWGMAKKHLVSVIDIINSADAGYTPKQELMDEKLSDLINYCILLEALLIERIEISKNV